MNPRDPGTLKDTEARLAHDIRGPLQAILGYAELLLSGKAGAVNSAQRKYIGHIQSAGEELRRRIEQIV